MRLPIELYSFIFECLGLKDLVRLRRVSKLWKSEIDRIRITDLVISWNGRPDESWHMTGDSINPVHCIEMDIFDAAYRKFQKHMTTVHFLSDLKRLKIADSNAPELSLTGFYQCLTKFRSLEQLEIEYELDERQTISHPNLQRLYFKCVNVEVTSIEIDCPSLKALVISGYANLMDVVYPESITVLSAVAWHDGEPQLNLKPFESIESLRCGASFRPINLTDHPKLKLVIFDPHSICEGEGEYEPDEVYLNARDKLYKLLSQKMQQKRSDLAIYFGDRLLTNFEQFTELDKEYLSEELDWYLRN